MGLDSVELVLMCEERFGVELPDAEVANAFTPRKLADLIFSKLKATDQKICQTQRAFYLLRRAFMRTLDMKRNQIALSSPIQNILPPGDLRPLWTKLKADTYARYWPDLSRPQWMRRVIFALSLAVATATMIYLQFGDRPIHIPTNLISSIMTALVVAAILTWFTRSFKRSAPRRLKTVGDLVQFVLSSDEVPWTRDAVAEQIKQMVIKEFDVPNERYGEDRHFIHDIGLDR